MDRAWDDSDLQKRKKIKSFGAEYIYNNIKSYPLVKIREGIGSCELVFDDKYMRSLDSEDLDEILLDLKLIKEYDREV